MRGPLRASTPPDHAPVALQHTHVQFAHCYKGQTGWDQVLSRFPRGGGTLYDLEFLTDEQGRRVAAFGYHAGYAGAALALMVWAHQLQHPDTPYGSVSSYPRDTALVADVKKAVAAGTAKNGGKAPTVMVIGALGRCGRGATDLCAAAGLPAANMAKWDLDETAKGGPFSEIAESDVFVNCIYLGATPIPPFVTRDSLLQAGPEKRRLSVVCDVSCDPNNPHNPVPIYSDWTTFDKPTAPVQLDGGRPLSVISIDHLPSLLPREASEAFSAALLPSLKQLDRRHEARVWLEAEKLFKEKVSTLPKGSM